MTNRCQCLDCLDFTHKSDCAVHGEPAMPYGECDCSERCGACGEELGPWGRIDHTDEVCRERLVALVYRRGIALKDIVQISDVGASIRARVALEPKENPND